MTDEEAQEQIFGLVRSQEETLAKIRERLLSFGNAFLRRWRKWSKTKRKEALQRFNPSYDLWQHEWGYIEAFKWNGVYHGSRLLDDPMLPLPYLDLNSLSGQSLKLLCLLRNRIRAAPADWASIDRAHVSCFSPESTRFRMHYESNPRFGSTERHIYGTMFTESTSETDRMEVSALHAVLMAQNGLVKFLDSITQFVTQDADERNRGCSDWDKFVNEEVAAGFESESPWPTYGNEIFSSPEWYQLTSIIEIAKARSQAAQDAIYALQTDPVYVASALRRVTRMKTYNAADEAGKAEYLTGALLMSVQGVIFWEWLCTYFDERLSCMGNTGKKEADTDGTGTEKTLAWPLIFLRELDEWWRICQEELKTLLPIQSDFVGFFEFKEVPTGGITIRAKKPTALCWEDSPSFWALGWLVVAEGHEDFARRRVDTPLYFRLLEHHPSARRLDQDIRDRISEMADIDEIKRIVLKCFPSASGMNVEASSAALGECEHTDIYRVKREILRVPILEITESGRSILNLLNGDAPNGPKNEKWLKKMTEARAQLSKAWTIIREYSWVKHPSALQLDVKMPLANDLRDGESPAELVTERRKEIIRMSENCSERYCKMIDEEAARVLRDRDIETWHMQPWNRLIGHAKDNQVNVRRRQVAKGNLSNPTKQILQFPLDRATLPDRKTPQSGIPSVCVKRSHYVRLCSLFPAPEAEGDRSRKVPWTDFVSAMKAAGFSVKECHGSARRFVLGSRPIIFHKPHPDPNLENNELLRMGKRMNRRFGWTLESLEVAAGTA